MKRYYRLLLIIICCTLGLLLSACDKSKSKATKPTTSPSLNLLQSFQTNPSVGIIVQNLNTGKISSSYNPHRSFTPASTTKLLTATAALAFLGPKYRFDTTINFQTDHINHRVLTGPLALSFTGDPTFTEHNLYYLLNTLRQHDIKRIDNDILIYTNGFTPYHPPHGYMWDDLNFGYAAPADAVIINHNQFKFKLYSSHKNNWPTRLVSKHSLTFHPVDNSVITQGLSEDDCEMALTGDRHNHYQLTGCMPLNKRVYRFSVAIQYPRYYLQQLLKSWLADHHIQLTGKIRFIAAQTSLPVIARHQSAPLANLIQHMLRTSDNLYANTLFKTLGRTKLNDLATWKNGQKAVEAILNELGISTQHLDLADGAGLSRYNRFTPELLRAVLQYNYQHTATRQLFLNSLAVAGENGTLRHFKFDELNGRFVGKTGTMKYISAVAGLLSIHHHPIAIVIMINGEQSNQHYFAVMHRVIAEVAKAAKSSH